MNTGKIKKFVAEHKKELIAGAAVVGGCVLVILGCTRLPKKRGNKSNRIFGNDVVIPEGLKVWNTSMLWHEGKHLNGIIESIPMDDLGELGEEFIKSGLAKPGDIASVIIGIPYNE